MPSPLLLHDTITTILLPVLRQVERSPKESQVERPPRCAGLQPSCDLRLEGEACHRAQSPSGRVQLPIHVHTLWHEATGAVGHCSLMLRMCDLALRIARYQEFKDYKKRILVTTDLFGRGIDIERVNIVINYDFPRAREVAARNGLVPHAQTCPGRAADS